MNDKPKCGDCVYRRPAVDKTMALLGFIRCEMQDLWISRTLHSHCAFEPDRFMPRAKVDG